MIHICKGLTPTDTEIYKTLKDMQPKKWAIKRNDCNKCEVNAWANNHRNEDTCKYESANGWIHSESISGYNLSLFGMSRHPSFTEITIEQFREITNPTKSNTMTPKGKEQLKRIIREASIPAFNMSISQRDRILALVDEYLPDGEITHGKGEPGLLPFKWPVPGGMKAIFFDGCEISDLQAPDKKGLYAYKRNGVWIIAHPDFLRLTPVEPEMETIWLNYYPDRKPTLHLTEERADSICIDEERIGPAIRVQFPKPIQ